VVNGAVKPIFFGFILTSVGCFYGMKAGGGAAMVGRTTTRAVVAAAVWILVANFLISKLLLNLWGNEG
jgi:phospholipid/cholesterol/gamma-HCH transport system permease protein